MIADVSVGKDTISVLGGFTGYFKGSHIVEEKKINSEWRVQLLIGLLGIKV